MQLDIIHIFLAQIDVNELLGNGATTAKTIAEGWDKQWLDILQNNSSNNLYRSLTNLGIFFAVGTLMFFMVQWLKDVIYYEYSRPISALIWPFLVVILLNISENGSALSNLTLAVRNLINSVNQQIVATTDANQVYQQAVNMSVAEEFAGSLLRPCQSLTGEQQTQCLIKAADKMEPLWQEYKNVYGNRPWIERLKTKVDDIKYGTPTVSETAFNALLGSNLQTSIKYFFLSLQYGFQNLIEATMLLIATLGPIAVGASLLPVAAKPIFAWTIGFLSVGIAKISFNIIAILTASVIVNGPGENLNADPDLMWFIIFLGILAPILSLLVATAGGFAVFNAINSTTDWVKERI
ncbi:hypothetical protein [Fortiea contorta]|uniref:hypothetical protein n=1 Tax=Fortiea contorta TaxID=1892405 RepID=UPI00037D18DC|nr:hypothetical protein [Fortiea contorta]